MDIEELRQRADRNRKRIDIAAAKRRVADTEDENKRIREVVKKVATDLIKDVEQSMEKEADSGYRIAESSFTLDLEVFMGKFDTPSIIKQIFNEVSDHFMNFGGVTLDLNTAQDLAHGTLERMINIKYKIVF